MNPVELPQSPFKGLVPFLEADYRFFFGRKRETQIITANLKTRRFTLLYGQSGVGKSSLINAGVAHGLRQCEQQPRAQAALPATVLTGNGSNLAELADARLPTGRKRRPAAVVVVFSEWVGDPLATLRAKIIDAVKEAAPGAIRPEAESSLRVAPLAELIKALTDPARVEPSDTETGELGDLEDGESPEPVGGEPLSLERSEPPPPPCGDLLIILDQFEEYFLYHPAGAGGEKFAEEFSRAVVSPRLRANFLVSIREDWLARLDRFRGRIPGLFDNSIGIQHLGREAAREAIEGPVAAYNKLLLKYGGKPEKIEIKKEFTEELLNQLEKLNEQDAGEGGRESVSARFGDAKPAETRIQARHLQIVLDNLWSQIRKLPTPTFGPELLPTPDTANKIINSHIGEKLNSLTVMEKSVAANLFRFLITPQGTKIAYTPGELARLCALPPAEVGGLLAKLQAPRIKLLQLVTPPPGQPTDTRYQLMSDVLAAPLIEWRDNIVAEQNRIFAEQNRLKVRRKRIVGGAFALLAIAAIGFGIGYWKVSEARQFADQQRKRAEEESARLQRGLEIFQKYGEEFPYAKAMLRSHYGTITSAAFIGDGQVLTASADGSAIIWDIETKKSVHEFKPEAQAPLTCATTGSDGKQLVTAVTDGTVTHWDTVSQRSVRLRGPGGGHVTDIRFSPKGDLLAASTTQGAVIVWNANDLSMLREMKENTGAIRQLSFSDDGAYLAAASEDHTATVWRVGDWTSQSLKGHTEMINGFAFNPKAPSLVTVSADKSVRLWNLSDGTTRTLGQHDESVNGVAFDREGGRVVTASDDKTARIWKLDDSKPVVLSGHEDKVLSADFAPDGRRVVTGSKDNTARIWSAGSGQSLAVLRGHFDEVTRVVFSPDGKLVLTASNDTTARIWFAPQPGELVIEPPTIDAVPAYYVGQCPTTIRFFVTITAKSGVGIVQYRFRASDGRIWPVRQMNFSEPNTQYVNWYWNVRNNYTGSMTVEVIDPPNIEPQKAVFRVKCNEAAGESPPPTPPGSETPSPTPTATP